MRALVTGASGFIGRSLCGELWNRDVQFTAVSRSSIQASWSSRVRSIGDLGAEIDWTPHLEGIDTVFHLAAHVHVDPGSAEDSWPLFERINVDATRRLAQASLEAGVQRFIFLSSVAAGDAERTLYGRSKQLAESELAKVPGLHYTVLRPPMVYGPGAPGRFSDLYRAIARGIPLPLGLVHARRSLIFVTNLVEAMLQCAARATGESAVYAVADDEPVSVSDLVREISAALSRRPRLFPVPPFLLRAGLRAAGKGHLSRALLEDCIVDDSLIRREIGWRSPLSREEGLRMTVRWYRSEAGRDGAGKGQDEFES